MTMIGRLLDAVRQRSGRPTSRPLRPNELRRDVIQAERRQRDVFQGNVAANRQDVSEEQRPRRQTEAPAARSQATTEPWHVTALKSRSGLRRAMLLKEILGPPASLRWPREGGPEL